MASITVYTFGLTKKKSTVGQVAAVIVRCALIVSKPQLFEDEALLDVDLGSTEWFAIQRRLIASRPLTKAAYDRWYDAMLADVATVDQPGQVLEIGSGSGFVKTLDPSVITSDIVPGHSDRIVDAEHLPFDDESLRAILLTHVFHHIPNVRMFLKEAQRTLVPGGVVTMVDVAHTPLSKLVFGRFHPEDYDPSAVEWKLNPAGPCGGANQAMSWIVFQRDRRRFEQEFPELEIQEIKYFPWLGYLLSGGVTRRDFVPASMVGIVQLLDKAATALGSICALHWHIRLRKKKVASDV
jgi:SAM-dependent methyltransferase